jgi:hypothetical protein
VGEVLEAVHPVIRTSMYLRSKSFLSGTVSGVVISDHCLRGTHSTILFDEVIY